MDMNRILWALSVTLAATLIFSVEARAADDPIKVNVDNFAKA
jgi:hypothetical protein